MPASILFIMEAKIFSEPPSVMGPGPWLVCPIASSSGPSHGECGAVYWRLRKKGFACGRAMTLDRLVGQEVGQVADALDRGQVFPEVGGPATGGLPGA